MSEALSHDEDKVARNGFKVAIKEYYAFYGQYAMYAYSDLNSRDLDEMEECVRELCISIEDIDLGDPNY